MNQQKNYSSQSRQHLSKLLTLFLITASSAIIVSTASAITITSSNIILRDTAIDPTDGSFTTDSTTVSPTTLPYNAASVVSATSNSSATATYSFSQTSLDVGMSLNPADAYYPTGWKSSLGESFGEIFFTTDEDINYTISGGFLYTGGLGSLSMDIFIQDMSDSSIIFRNKQMSSWVTPEETFYVGGVDGEYYNENIGDLSGLLNTGSYRFRWQWSVLDRSYGNSPLTATGDFNVSFTPSGSDPVPEPATMLLFGTGLVGLVGSRLRKTKK